VKIRKLILLAVAACMAHGSAWSIPNGGVVVRGGATFDPRGNVLIITNTPGTIIEWPGFNIAPGEIARFVQRGSSSAVLNRITGQDPTQVLGALESNGHVFLVNPNGIVFGAGSRVDVNGLVASTLDITNADFAAGRRVFDAAAGRSGTIRNDGAITTPSGGRVYLIASSIENNGIISSPRGDVMLAAGHHVDLVDSGAPDVQVVVSAPADRAVNLGRILSEGGSIGIYGALVNQRGLVSADSAVRGEDGRIVFRASGETRLEQGSATSARGMDHGGSIQVLGDHVGITGDALVDASGERGGGTVLVGGDFHGANPGVANASATFIGAQARIRADAMESGDGGRVAVWSDGATRAYGSISARGGESSGDGGFAEVSGRGFLDYGARTDLRASHGAAGTLLLDPNDITIQAGPASGSNVPASGPPVVYSGGPATSIITVTDLQAQLGLGSVTVSTAGGSGGPGGGRITVADAVGWSNGAALTLSADNGIAINGAISAPADGRLILASNGGTITQTAPLNVTYLVITSLGDVNLDTAANTVYTLSAHVGDASHQGLNFRFLNAGPLLVHSLNGVSGVSADQGFISLTATSGGITQTAGSILAGLGATLRADSVVLTEANAVAVVSGRLNNVPGSDGFAFTGAGSLDAGTVMGVTGIQAPGSGANLIAGGSITGSISGDHVALAAGSGISVATQTPAITATNGTGAISITNAGGLTVEDVTQSGGGAITLSAGPTGSVNDKLVINGSVSTTGPILLRAGDAITVNGTINGSATQQPFLNIPVLPSLPDCIANPLLAGCSAVLPTLNLCVANPALAGCSVILPSLSQCLATPLAMGCSAVLPSLASCTATPTLAGCSVVLPFLSACIADPTLAGCSVVLPTLTQCAATPTLAGCSAVLPTFAQCVATRTLPGCSVVLPSLAQCIANPTLPGCAVQLPTLAQCIASPSLAGCSAVLPSIAQCASTPTLAGCSAVLPTLAQCAATPTLAGCAAVLPTLAQCVVAPALAGCGAVLPSVSQCVSVPNSAGCSVVLPPLQQGPGNEPLSQAINSTVNLINTSTTVSLAGGGDARKEDVKKDDGKKDDGKKDDGKKDSVTASDKSGAKNDDAAKKMYCN
jgi:filamentous hemagglutinin family protein